jgi:hypothetical protein
MGLIDSAESRLRTGDFVKREGEGRERNERVNEEEEGGGRKIIRERGRKRKEGSKLSKAIIVFHISSGNSSERQRQWRK